MEIDEKHNNKKLVIMNGFDIERILRQEGAPKAFAKAVAAACRAAGLVDRCQADDSSEIKDLKEKINSIIFKLLE